MTAQAPTLRRPPLLLTGLAPTAVLVSPGCGGDDEAASGDTAGGVVTGNAPADDAPAGGTTSGGTTSDTGLAPPNPMAGASAQAALSYNAAWLDALREHGFDQASFTQVHTAVTLAFGAVMAEEQMQQAKHSLSPQQYEMMKEAMGGTDSPFGAVPAEHRELVEAMLHEVKAAFGYEGP